MISGFQWPLENGGSSHSSSSTRRGSSWPRPPPLRRRPISPTVSLNPAIIDSASAALVQQVANATEHREDLLEVRRVEALDHRASPARRSAASRTVSSLTAQTSHCSWVRIRSGAQLGQELLVELVQTLVMRRDQLVDLGAGCLGVDLVPGQEGQCLDAWREVALVGHAHQVLLVPEGTDQLGQGRKKTDDSHEPLLSKRGIRDPITPGLHNSERAGERAKEISRSHESGIRAGRFSSDVRERRDSGRQSHFGA